ncbi:MAG: Vitamin B12 import ATP-binding protein BtuD [Planctomycetes bacterium]|nr:Vitamin B12 import ATP-binding protein BtuD [Planctomycetota bacterium]
MTAPAVRFDRVSRSFRRGGSHDALRDLLASVAGRRAASRDEFLAVDDVSFEVAPGEAVGLMGPNGSGKSTSLKLLSGIMPPTSGEVTLRGRVAPLIEVGAGFHPDLTGRENIDLNAAILGMTAAEIRARFDAIVAFSGLEAFLDTPVKRYSSGMYMRLGFAIAAHMPCDVLLVDEVLAVGDVGFRAKCVERMQEMKRAGTTILFVSHHGHQVRTLCDRVVCLLRGRKVYDGPAAEGVKRYVADALAEGAPDRAGPGDGGGIVASVAFASGRDVERIAPGGALEADVVVATGTASAAPVLAVSVVRPDGVVACAVNSRDCGFRLEPSPAPQTVRVRLDALPLHPQRYVVEATLWDAEMVSVLGHATGGFVDVEVADAKPVNRPGICRVDGSFRRTSP